MTGEVQQDASCNAGTKVTVGLVGPIWGDSEAGECSELPNFSELEEQDNQGIFLNFCRCFDKRIGQGKCATVTRLRSRRFIL
jgi:hypothetical protein